MHKTCHLPLSHPDEWIPEKPRRWIALVLITVEMFFFGGIHYGYNALIPAYKAKGVFASYCTADNCHEQDKMYSYAFLVWIISQKFLLTIPGVILDHCGVRTAKLVSVVCFSVGALMMGFTTADSPSLLFVGGCLMALGSMSNLTCNLRVSCMFPHGQGLVVALLGGAFASSTTCTFFIARMVPIMSMKYSFLIVAIVSLFLGTGIALFLLSEFKHIKAPELPDPLEKKEIGETSEPHHDEHHGWMELDETPDIAERIDHAVDRLYRSIWSCLFSPSFVLISIWFVFVLLQMTFFLSQLDSQLYFGFAPDKATVEYLLQLSSAFTMFSLFGSPLAGLALDGPRIAVRRCLDRRLLSGTTSDSEIYWFYLKGLTPVLALTPPFAILMSSSLIAPSNVSMYYFAFVCLVFVRSLLFTGMHTYLLLAFPNRHFGVLNGVINFLAGLFTLLEYAFLQLHLYVSNGICVAICSVALVVPIAILCKSR